LLQRTRSLHQATGLECLNKLRACNSDQGVFGYLPMQPEFCHIGESKMKLRKKPQQPRRLQLWIVSVPAYVTSVGYLDIVDQTILTNRGFLCFESKDGENHWSIYMARYPYRGGGFSVSHGACKPRMPARSSLDTNFPRCSACRPPSNSSWPRFVRGSTRNIRCNC
jgi:hypothetical protein